MINPEVAALNDVAEEFVMAPLIFFERGMRRGNSSNFEDAKTFRLFCIHSTRVFEHYTETIRHESAVRLGNHQLHSRIRLHQRYERLLVEVVRVIVARGHHIDEVEALRHNDAFSHAHVRPVGGGVFVRERIREVWIEEQMVSLPLEKKSALPEPPEMNVVRVFARSQNVRKKVVIF